MKHLVLYYYMRSIAVRTLSGFLLSFILFCALIFGLGCGKKEAAEAVNPRLAKSGKKLADEPEVAVANDSSESISAEGTQDKPISTPQTASGNNAQAAAAAATSVGPRLSPAQVQHLIRLAQSGNAAAQVELGNAFFEGNGVAKNKEAAGFWWRKAALQNHPVGHENLRMLMTKPEHGVSFFGTKAKGNRFVFIIDKSGSMGQQGRFQRAKTELVRTLKSLPRDAHFMVYFFSSDFEKLPFIEVDKMPTAVPENIRMAEDWINGRSVMGGTNPIGALADGFRLKPDTVWLLTDGRFANDGNVLNRLRRLNPNTKARINTVAIMDPAGENVLKQIAGQHDGTYRFVKFDGR